MKKERTNRFVAEMFSLSACHVLTEADFPVKKPRRDFCGEAFHTNCVASYFAIVKVTIKPSTLLPETE